jgi:dTDP-4-dehydrorhamnose 3,5-epimerase-like enzyme
MSVSRRAIASEVGDRLSPATEPYVVDAARLPPADGAMPAAIRSDAAVGATGARIVQLPRIADPRGNLTVIENETVVPFQIQRVFYLYDVPGGAMRGGHAHRQLEQFVIAPSGSFEVLVDDGVHQERFFLNRSYFGLHIPPMVWGELDNFSSGAVCLVLASRPYEEDDYYRSYEEFVRATRLAA